MENSDKMEMWTIVKWILALFLIIVLSVVVKMGYDKAKDTSMALSNPYCDDTGYDFKQMSGMFKEKVEKKDFASALNLYDLHSNCFEIKDLGMTDVQKESFCKEGESLKFKFSSKTQDKIKNYCS